MLLRTTTDNFDFIQVPQQLAESLGVYTATPLDILKNKRQYRSWSPHFEPQLGR
jgi:aminopeptidase-like protein